MRARASMLLGVLVAIAAITTSIIISGPYAKADPERPTIRPTIGPIKPRACKIELKAAATGTYLIKFSGKIVVEGNRPFPRANVTLAFGGKQKVVTAGRSGNFSGAIQSSQPTQSGKLMAQATYPGSRIVKGCSAQTPVFLKSKVKAGLTASAVPQEVAPGSVVQVRGRLTADGSGLSGVTLALKPSWGSATQVVTNGDGSYTGFAGVPADARPGRASITVAFQGEAGYLATSRSVSVSIVQAKNDPTPTPTPTTSEPPSPAATKEAPAATPSDTAPQAPEENQQPIAPKRNGLPFGVLIGLGALGAVMMVVGLIALGVRYGWATSIPAEEVDRLIE